MKTRIAILYTLLSAVPLCAQEPAATTPSTQRAATAPDTAAQMASQSSLDQVTKRVDDLLWFTRLADIAEVDKVEYTSSPPAHASNPKAPGALNPIIIHAYTFIPKTLDRSRKQPLITFAHQGVHANFDTSDLHVIRELLEQGYCVIASDYRGSTGYGLSFYQQIDYGGREIDDVFNGTQWMIDRYPFIDAKRLGMMGWSHGGFITLMNIMEHASTYAVAYAGVPVSDLVARMGYEPESYRELYSAPYHIGKPVRDDIEEYRRRSPVNHVKDLQTPLLVHANTNDEDVNYLEVEHLIQALKAEGKKFEYKVYENAPGGHYFNRTDTKMARDSRADVYRFLASYLHPVNPPR